MAEFSLRISVAHPVLFLSDPSVVERVPADTGAAPVTFTEDCICFWVQSDVDGDAAVTISDQDCRVGAHVFSGELASPGRVVALSTSHRVVFLNIPVKAELSAVEIWMSDPSAPEWAWVKLPIEGR